MIASVIIDIANKQVNRSFDYIIPSHLEQIIKPGFRVKVPFANVSRTGYVIEVKNNTAFNKKLKEIIDVIDIYRPLNEEFIELAKYIAENNFSYYATALSTMIPTALKIKYKKIAKALSFDNLSAAAKDIFKKNTINLDSLNPDLQKIVYQEVKQGNVLLDTEFKKNRNEAKIKYYYANEECNIKPSSKRGAELLDFLLELKGPVEEAILLEDSGFSKSVLSTLIKNGQVLFYEKENLTVPEEKIIIPDKKVELNEYQKKAINSIKPNLKSTYLLHGVTGSGKTEVYMRLIENTLKENKTAIMLVPEISLTPQITAVFQARFKSDIAILHSRLSIKEKYIAWKRVLNNEVKIVIGARSAIFAPLNNLGIIIIDECHESTYTQQNNPKYSALDIAIKRSENHNCPLVLGSATPNVADYFKATNGEYKLIDLPVRVNGNDLPEVEVIDLREELKSGNKSVFSSKLKNEILLNLKNKEQTILFLNRRGYSSFVMCRMCGEVVKCPHCDVSLTYHSVTQSLSCHYCGYTIPNVSRCRNCGSDKIRYVGSGTEKVKEELHNLVPEANVIRLDMDTAIKMEDYEAAFEKFRRHEADILVGTQMITKGLDFDNVTLVGVINADLALQYPAYDSNEVAYNLIEQVSGRAGRSNKPGRVIVQTYNPDNYVIKCAKNHDYDMFYSLEIRNRMHSNMPPYSDLVEIMISSTDAEKAFAEAKVIKRNLDEVNKSSEIYGPSEARIFKLNDVFRFIIQVKVCDDSIYEMIRYIYPLYQNNKDIDVNITKM